MAPLPPNLGIVAPMEPLQHQLSIDSFSYSWLLNINSSFDSLDDGLRFSLDAQDAGSFIEMDPKLISMRWKADSLDFGFSLPSSQSPLLVHADQIFSDGLLLPRHLITPRRREVASNSSMNSVLLRSLSLDSSKSLLSGSNRFGSRYFYAVPSSPVSSNSSSLFGPVQGVPTSSCSSSSKSMLSRGSNSKLHLLGGCTKPSKKFIQRYLSFLMPLYKKFKGLQLIRRAGSRVSSTRGCVESIGASPRTSETLSSFKSRHGRRTFDMGTENAINDAVLHCKKSIGTGESTGTITEEGSLSGC
ncbi:probable membrane-associated kinase regulator 6 isoform X1 [Phoenix dactylifera]|uniref:Probable membrane-associated kinase regulator 6 isoform X1 n=1 Tax=Phoenix dactylifera TaxID=42345 RepID=A0A8B7CLY4_PHODC|nr:probable membrane-associated kinase regulator 6 isoform X1 [Phoenix dactylifera]